MTDETTKTTKPVSAKEQRIAQLVPHRFRKGSSGNPNGRPKGTTSITKIIREACNYGGAEMAVAGLMEVLAQPDHKHFATLLQLLLERMDGKVGSQLEDALLKRLQEGITLNTTARPQVELPQPSAAEVEQAKPLDTEA